MSQVARCWGSSAWPPTAVWGHMTLTLEKRFQELKEIVQYYLLPGIIQENVSPEWRSQKASHMTKHGGNLAHQCYLGNS